MSQTINAETVLDNHLAAFTQQNLSAIMENYHEDSVLVTNIGTFSGRIGIERFFDDLFADFSQEGTTINICQRIVKQPFAYIVWRAKTPENVYEFATETFYIPEDEIQFQTLAVDLSQNN